MQTRERAKLGERLRRLRKRNGWTLAVVSRMTGLAPSTLSKVENNQMSLTYDYLVKLTNGLDIDIAELFNGTDARPASGRRSITRRGEGRLVKTQNYDYEYLCSDLAKKRMIPIFTRIKAHTIEEFGALLQHGGEEVIYVLDGAIEVHTEFYEPVVLKTGDCIYLDSTMGHGYLAAVKKDAAVLGVCSGPDVALAEIMKTTQPQKAQRMSASRKTKRG